MFERYTVTLDKDYKTQFIDVRSIESQLLLVCLSIVQAVNDDDNIPMDLSNREDAQKQQLLMTCFVTPAARDSIYRQVVSDMRSVCSANLYSFVQQRTPAIVSVLPYRSQSFAFGA